VLQARAVGLETALRSTHAVDARYFVGYDELVAPSAADGVVLLGDAGGYDDPVDGQGLSLAMRDVRQLSELLLATDDWTVAGLRPYGQQRTERLRRMRRVSRTYAALMTTFTADGRARRDRFRAASGAGGDDARLALGEIHLGPVRRVPC
jgi:2-polyprenyl-6-methoxyphenol hydroxylase-like FAD-dependent oxidoreductase